MQQLDLGERIGAVRPADRDGAVAEVAARYRGYFDATLERVAEALRPVTAAERPRVLYLQPGTLTQPRLIAEWWIPAAGGISVTDDGRTAESRTFSLEQVLLWGPDILIVTDPKDVTMVANDRLFRQLKAVQGSRVHVAPSAPIPGPTAPPSSR